MSGERFVVLGLARARAAWFATVTRDANAGALPVEFVKCVSPEQLRARLGSARVHSAVLVDAAVAAAERDLFDLAASRGAAVVVVDSGDPGPGPGGDRDRWLELGAAATLPDTFDRAELLAALTAHASPVADLTGPAAAPGAGAGTAPARSHGSVVAVCGPGGAGSSTLAIALAQGLALGGHAPAGGVLLADLCLRADQAMLHDAGDVVPGVQELVELCRHLRPEPADVRALAFAVPARRYHLLLGIRRAAAWTTLRPRAVATAVDALAATYPLVVADADADLEGEAATGSVDVEERNALARTAALGADVVVVVGLPGLKGVHALARTIDELLSAGVAAARIVPAVNRAPRARRARRELAATVVDLVNGGTTMRPVMFVPERDLDTALYDGTALPVAVTEPLVAAVTAATRDVGPVAGDAGAAGDAPRRLRAGELGHWDLEEAHR